MAFLISCCLTESENGKKTDIDLNSMRIFDESNLTGKNDLWEMLLMTVEHVLNWFTAKIMHFVENLDENITVIDE